MTAVIHHGPPGSYKTFALIQRVIIPALQQGRTVCHNIRGLNSIERIASVMKTDIPPEARLIAVEHDSQAGFDYMARFFQWAPIGALIVMDEGQRVYPTRLRNLGEFDTPDDEQDTTDTGPQRPWNVENAFDQHRHMNWDIYISTTNVAKIHKEVRAVVEYGFRHRDLAGVLPWYKNKWREFRHDAESSGKAVSHYIGTPNVYSADPRVFQCYQSTATGTAQGSSENKSLFADPKLRIFLTITVLCVAYFIHGVSNAVDRYQEPADTIVAAPVSSDAVHLRPDGRISGHQNGDEAELPVGLAYLKAINPYIEPDTTHALPQSERWRLSSVIQGPRFAVATITDEHKTLHLDLLQSCALVGPEWLCWFENSIVAMHTGSQPMLDDTPRASIASSVTALPTPL